MIEKTMKLFVVFFLFYGLHPSAWACENMRNQIIDIRLHPEIEGNFGQKKVGDTLYSVQSSLAELTKNSDELACSETPSTLSTVGRLSGREMGKRVYPTSVPGIGIRIFYLNHQVNSDNRLKVMPFNDTTIMRKNVSLRPENIALKIELIKTGPIRSAQALVFNQASLLSFALANHLSVINLHVIGNFPETVCNFDAPQILIHLPEQLASTIKRNKTNSKYPVPVKIYCNGEPQLMTLTLHGDAYDASKGILNPEVANDTAKGVGIQLWYRTHPITIGKPIPIYKINDLASSNRIVLPLFVSYIRTQHNIEPGKINASVVLHIEYL